ncbi:glycosyltransferase domain-containing protein [Collinsella ihumii]|uniref:DUF616 domain-containing protein n=1 Tax=Collinsella ihumii TaxID=1720204 RepID=A0ABT7XD07_9ACTN|nr:glycosyltransferase domain-containing protein [Collinsella ihumii]MDN0063294.1 DUF616 domain-containing protein [Collinsella ihumii]
MYLDKTNKELILQLSKRCVEIESSRCYKVCNTLKKAAKTLYNHNLNIILNKIYVKLFHPWLNTDVRSKSWKEYVNTEIAKQHELQKTTHNEKITVYTCITGNYDTTIPIPFQAPNTEYVLFTDNIELKCLGWNTVPIPKRLSSMNARDINRYIKMHPHEFFRTPFSVYIDGNVWLLCDPMEFCISAKYSNSHIAMFAHGLRDCVYDEGKACRQLNRGDADGIRQQLSVCNSLQIQPHSGLLEACIIASDISHPDILTFYNIWWNQYIENGSERDQLALPAAIILSGLDVQDFGILGDNARNDPRLRFLSHG